MLETAWFRFQPYDSSIVMFRIQFLSFLKLLKLQISNINSLHPFWSLSAWYSDVISHWLKVLEALDSGTGSRTQEYSNWACPRLQQRRHLIQKYVPRSSDLLVEYKAFLRRKGVPIWNDEYTFHSFRIDIFRSSYVMISFWWLCRHVGQADGMKLERNWRLLWISCYDSPNRSCNIIL